MSPSELYTLIVSGERFTFTRDQLESDPDNYFATYFFGSFSEASNGAHELTMEKEPALFRLIQAHLRGYKVLPIPDRIVPVYMTKETMLDNLLVEAEYYALEELVRRIKGFQAGTLDSKSKSVNEKTLHGKRYKFGRITESFDATWNIGNIPDLGAEILLQRFYTSSNMIPVSAKAGSIDCPGYKVVGSWSDREGGCDFALLEPEE